MAASANPTDLKYLLECNICLNRFQDPRVLPCLHSYCLECLKSHVTTNKDHDGTFNCPECREKCTIPEDGVDKFPKNFFVNAMKDVIPVSFLQEPNVDEASSPAPVMCKYYSEENASEHGTAVIFCAQCDVHVCQVCSKHHGLFAVTKDHNVVSVGLDEATSDVQIKKTPNCELHPNLAINWYCKTCSLPACSDCIIEKHDGHMKEKLTITEAAFKLDMLDVSKLAAKRIEDLQKISANLNANKIKMEEELEQASRDISESADNMCRLIRQSEATLQDKVKKAREVARKHFATTTEELETVTDNSSSLKSCAESLHEASPEQALCTVLQAPIKKQQFLHQQDTPVPSVQWHLDRSTTEPGQLCDVNCLGMLDVKMLVEFEKRKEENVVIDAPLKTIKLKFTDNKCVLGIALIHGNLVCIAHFEDHYIWVYTNEGQLKQKIRVPGIDKLSGMQVIDNQQGKLVIVGDSQHKVHFITLSRDLKITQHLSKDVPMVVNRISKCCNADVIVNCYDEKRLLVLNADGQVLHDTQLAISHDEVYITCITRSKSGFVVCDHENKQIYFTDVNGHILHTHTNCGSPRCVVQTTWGHALVADIVGDEVKVFNEAGDFLGNVHDNHGSINNPHYICVDEEHRLKYVARGAIGEYDLSVYKFAPSDLQQLPVKRSVTRLAVDFKLATVE